MNRNCNIVRDLLPLYVEKMLSADSQAFVEEHLKDCEDCRKELESLKQGDSSVSMVKDHTDEAIPIKKVKKKLSKKKAITIITAVVLTLAAVIVFTSVKSITVDYKNSDIYSQEEIKSAVECVKDDFKSLHGCKLYSLSYAGDEQVQRETAYRLERESQYEEYILIDSVFRSPIFGGGGWNSDDIYTWHWILGRNAGGEWVVIDKGYC